MRFMDLARPTARGTEHEITTLKRQDKQDLRYGAAKGCSTLFVYDSVIVDFQFAYNLKQSKSIYILTSWKDNLAPMTVMPRPFDRANPANSLVISDETLYFNNTPGVWRRITPSCPDSEEIYITLTNQMTLLHGALNQSAVCDGPPKKPALPAATYPQNSIKPFYRPTEMSLQFIRWLRVCLTRPTCYRRAIEKLRPPHVGLSSNVRRRGLAARESISRRATMLWELTGTGGALQEMHFRDLDLGEIAGSEGGGLLLGSGGFRCGHQTIEALEWEISAWCPPPGMLA
jgi:hypothetical protein